MFIRCSGTYALCHLYKRPLQRVEVLFIQNHKMESTQQPSEEFTNPIVNSTSELKKSSESMTSWFTCGLTDFHHCAVFIICSAIFLAGFLGNIVVIVLLSTKEQFQKTATFVSIKLLALSDMMTQTWLYVFEMFVVSNILDLNYLSTFECSSVIVIGVTQFLLSLYALAILALVRYHAIVYPLQMSRFKSRKFVVEPAHFDNRRIFMSHGHRSQSVSRNNDMRRSHSLQQVHCVYFATSYHRNYCPSGYSSFPESSRSSTIFISQILQHKDIDP